MAISFWIVGALSVVTAGGICLVIKDKHRRKLDSIECFIGEEQDPNFDIFESRELRTVPVAKIIGSIGRCFDFDSSFRLKKHLPLERFSEIKRIMKKSQPLPPVTLYRVNNKYYVMDGHHRVSAAKLLCHNEIVANVISIEMKR